EPIAARVADLRARGIEAAAVALLHADRFPDHERRLAGWLRERGFRHVSCSADMAQTIKILPRAETAVVDAALSAIVGGYLERISSALGGGRLHVMTSAGGLIRAAATRPKDMLLSGPAGGVVGAAAAGRRSGENRVISFDMGGTSTDVARYDGDFEYVFEHRVGDARLVAPALAIETVAAGGGSICTFDAAGLRVGPESAGALPGPACYGAGGPLTLTDVNLLLGRLDPDRFGIPIDRQCSQRALESVKADVERATGERIDADALLEGFIALANEKMADAIRGISIRRGYAPEEYTLVAFGGAGGQHATAIARHLGMRTVIVPADAGLLSAAGMEQAMIERFAERQVLALVDTTRPRLAGWWEELAERATDELAREGFTRSQIVIRRRLASLRFEGQDAALEVEIAASEAADPQALAASFARRFFEVYGHQPERRSVELVSLRVVASQRPARSPARALGAVTEHRPGAEGRQRARVAGRWVDIPVFTRERLASGARIDGPALVTARHSTTYIEPGWCGEIDGELSLRLVCRDRASDTARGSRPEAVRVELFTHRLETIAREMGQALERTAVSTNVKERRDFSCAVLNARGELVVNAPHIPVHLGSLGVCVRRVCETLELAPGDVVVTNHPGYGGSHLPDVTLVAPVFVGGGRLLGYTAARAHHAEIGGTTPGSMPPRARRLIEEGVVLPPTHLVRGGEARWELMRQLLTEAPHPTRRLEDNLSDLAAALAACHRGAAALAKLAAREGADVVSHYMEALEARAERRLREALAARPDGVFRAEEILDDGSRLAVRLTIEASRAIVDFTGTSAEHPGNLNATPAIVRSVVLYVLRLLVDEPLPLNEGLMRAVEIVLPRGMLNPEFADDAGESPAVVGGNVETSQRLANMLVRAFGLAASSQGTMNNVLFGNQRLSYYETVGGGGGAGEGFDGASAVHTHMTNTRITDPELLEHRYPVRLERFAVRRGSGGSGRRRGGDGIVRELTFLEPLELSLLTQHRRRGPAGLAGGGDGAPGRQRLVRASGASVELDAIDGAELAAGDRLILETPGGGGYGAKP
ncbi:MAG: hydantoinase B/oxoprolinase family protein, partial [Acidobacteriota bacterium]